jgi:HAD superfamily hydrolase (TIGR01549 family)
MNSIKAICFDFDGTLAEFIGDFPKYIIECFVRLGINPSPEFLHTFNQHLRSEGHLTSRMAFERTCRDLDVSIPDNPEPIYQLNVDAYAAQVKLLPNALATLEYFHNIPKAIITNGPSDMQWAAIHKVGLADLFKTIIVSGDADVAIRKPNPNIFHLACERLGVLPENVLMIGDNVEADIQGAIKAGLQGLHVA